MDVPFLETRSGRAFYESDKREIARLLAKPHVGSERLSRDLRDRDPATPRFPLDRPDEGIRKRDCGALHTLTL
jgi:hypothetical protein